MIITSSTAFFIASVLVVSYLLYRKMPKSGSPLFKVGYFLYTRTPLGYFYYRREVSKAQQKYNGATHSVVQPTVFQGLRIVPMPMSLDNYGYLIIDEQTNTAVMVDPAEPGAVQPVLEAEKVTPVAILTTHKHWDHSGGNTHWKRLFRNIQVHGGTVDNVPGVTHGVADGDQLEYGRLRFTAHFTPGHTVGHIVYVLDGYHFGAPDSLFSGDHLFLGGCGRLFEGPPATMLRSLDSVSALNGDTLLWPGHEYATDNLEFAVYVDPLNPYAQSKYDWVRERRKEKLCTSPSTLAEEMSYNPFLRTGQTSIQQALELDMQEGEDVGHYRARLLKELRNRKDKFKYKL